MRTLLKSVVARTVAASGGLRRLHAGRLVILTFHRIRPDNEEAPLRPMRNLEVSASDFRALLLWMKERYDPVALGDWIGRTEPLPRASFAVTFDDGWADNFTEAYPILRELKIPASIFLATGAVEERIPFWWQHPGLSDEEIEVLKDQPQDELEARAAADTLVRQAHANDFLTWEAIREMAGSGWVRFGPHGHRHALMTSLTREEALADIQECWDLLKQEVPVALLPVLAWPNGNARTDLPAALQEMGLQAAVGTQGGAVARAGENRWQLPRNNVDRLASQEPGLWPWLLMRAR
jgi:peptidoglycan/xylan/chitin deacetylase (PgdA/CDA1 family)